MINIAAGYELKAKSIEWYRTIAIKINGFYLKCTTEPVSLSTLDIGL